MLSIRGRFLNFLSSPQNQTGLILLASTIPAYAAQIESHDTSLAVAAGAIFAGLLHIILPDDPALIAGAPRLAADAVGAIQNKNASDIPQILSDAANVAADILPSNSIISKD